MALSTQPYKGARDFYPEDKRIQDYMFGVIRHVAKSYGYQEYDAPILEPLELYKAKTGDEIVNEQTYTFTDRGGREVTLRPEMTPTVSRMVAAKRQELAYPLRWFSIPNLWRYERPQRGRLREHWQLNVDLFGEEGLPGDHEIIKVADSILKAFGAKPHSYQIKLNSRQLINELMFKYLGLNEEKAHALTKLIDRMNKMEPAAVQEQIDAICVDMLPDVPTKINLLLQIQSIDDLPEQVKMHPSVIELRELIILLEDSNITNAVFDITLMRGFDYYTDIVFEVFDTDPDNNRSMFGGGRYDGLVGMFGVDPVPTVGFGMGDVTLANFLKAHGLMPELKSETDILLILIGDVYPGANKLAAMFREMEINVSIDATYRKLDKKLKHADRHGIRYVVFVGEQELEDEVYPLKDLVTGNEEKHSAERIVSIIRDYRAK
jgi:histidyl-tRNA synthetase